MEPSVLDINVSAKQVPRSKYHKIMTTFYKALHVLSGLDFGFFEQKSFKLSIFCKSISISQCVLWSAACLLTRSAAHDGGSALWDHITVVHYVLIGLRLTLFNPNRTFHSFFYDLDMIDFKLKLRSESFNLELKATILIVLHFSCRIIINFIYCYYYEKCINPVPSLVIIKSIAACLYSVNIAYGFMFCSVNCRLVELASVLRAASSGFSSLQYTYRSIVDLTEEYKTAFDPVYTGMLLSCVPEIMAHIYFAVTQYRRDTSVVSLGLRYLRIEYVVAAEGLLLLFAPAVCAGMLSAQAVKIKVILHDKLQDLDATNNIEIERFIRYVEARPLQLRLYKVVPLDADLPVLLLNFCVTYLIVIIQFTN